MKKNLTKIYDLVKRAKSENRDLTEEELRSLTEEDEKKDEPSDTPKEDEPKEDEDPKEEDPKEDEPKEEKSAEENKDADEDNKEDDSEEDEPSESGEEPSDDTETEDKENKTTSTRKMEKKFSLLKTIRSLAENKPLDENTNAIIEQGRAEMRKSGLSSVGQIVLPTEKRAVVSYTADGVDTVSTDVFDLLTPLRAKNVLAQAGAKFYTNLVGDVKIPVMNGSNVTFEAETAPAKDGGASFSHITLSPKRLTAYVDISKQMLAQDSVDIENAIREDLINAINGKIEDAVLSDFTGSTTQFKGVFAAVKPTAVADFKALVDKEATVEDANINGTPCYILSNKAKAALRAMAKGTKSTQLVYENGEVDGTPAYNTSHVGATNYLFGDMSNIVIGVWAGIDMVNDVYTQAANGCIRLVVNLYVDAQIARPECLTAGKIGPAA
jgi:HK97 family phage major capsid protein